MKKLIRGILDFKKNIRPGYRETFARLALGQKPDSLLIACSDSRVAPNLFASTEPGDMFVIRNVGNMVPPAKAGSSTPDGDHSEAAAVEFSLSRLPVRDVIVCGHSDCGAMQALVEGKENLDMPCVRNWLQFGDEGLELLLSGQSLDKTLSPVNQLSQLNVIQQMKHIQSYPYVQKRIADGNLRIHGWWFDIRAANVSAYDPNLKKFIVIDENYAKRFLEPENVQRT
jgi:carbonic anhydrase